jgi:predicted protein tyrosine phosphatase
MSFITSHPSIVVCDAGRATQLCEKSRAQIHGMISIADPPPYEQKRPRPSIIPAIALLLDFRDVWADHHDGIKLVNAPSLNHVDAILKYGHDLAALGAPPSGGRLVIHCTAGRSRSTAAAFIILCDRYGVGNEQAAMDALLTCCERAPLPNTLLCKLADDYLGRGGRLHKLAIEQNENPRDAEADAGKPITGTALLNAVRRGEI